MEVFSLLGRDIADIADLSLNQLLQGWKASSPIDFHVLLMFCGSSLITPNACRTTKFNAGLMRADVKSSIVRR